MAGRVRSTVARAGAAASALLLALASQHIAAALASQGVDFGIHYAGQSPPNLFIRHSRVDRMLRRKFLAAADPGPHFVRKQQDWRGSWIFLSLDLQPKSFPGLGRRCFVLPLPHESSLASHCPASPCRFRNCSLPQLVRLLCPSSPAIQTPIPSATWPPQPPCRCSSQPTAIHAIPFLSSL